MRKLLFAILLLVPFFGHSQVFKAGITAGPSFSQIAGDEVAGYYKFGLQAGVVADIFISKNFSWGLEILYSQRGSNSTDRNFDFKIATDYIEIPLLFSYNDKNDMSFYLGGSFNRLLNVKFWSGGIETPFEDFDTAVLGENETKKTDINLIAGLRYAISPVFNVGVRLNRAVTAFKRNAASNFRNQGMYHNSVALRCEFIFSAMGDK